MSQHRKLFGTDGVRGLANKYPMTPELALRLGQAAAKVLSNDASSPEFPRPVCLIGRDTRASGSMLEAALAAGLNSLGIDVALGGIIPTPAVALLVRHHGYELGAVISASHNPAEDNGIKFFGGSGFKLTDEQEAAIEALVTDPSFPTNKERPTCEGIGETVHLVGDYLDPYLIAAAKVMGGRSLAGKRIVVDAANGASLNTSAKVFEQLGATVERLHHAPNGQNINADCGCLHPSDLEAAVRASGADFGLAHDGDADRVILCDETGTCLMDADEILAIAAVDYLKRGALENNTLVATVMSNGGLDDLVREHGGRIVRSGVGDRYVLEAMRREGSNVGGEQSGHIIFLDHNTTGDGLITALEILRIVIDSGKPLSELRRCLVRRPQLKENLRVAHRLPLDELPESSRLIEDTNRTLGENGQILVRYSGTEPLIRVLLEGKDEAFLQARMTELVAALKRELA